MQREYWFRFRFRRWVSRVVGGSWTAASTGMLPDRGGSLNTNPYLRFDVHSNLYYSIIAMHSEEYYADDQFRSISLKTNSGSRNLRIIIDTNTCIIDIGYIRK